MDWYRNWNGTPFDKKWPLVSKRSGQPILSVVGVWTVMLDCASAASERGTLEDWDDEVVAANMGVETEVISSIREAMQGLTLDGNRLKNWDKRQRVSDDVAARVKKHRDSKKAPPEDGNPGGNGTETEQTAPKSNGPSRNGHVTLQEQVLTECNVTATLGSSRAKTPDSQIEDSEGGDARTREASSLIWLVRQIAALTNLPITDAATRTVADWIERGADPVLDILPAVEAKLETTRVPHDQIEGFGFFRNSVLKHHHQRLNPQPERPKQRPAQGYSRPVEKGAAQIVELFKRCGGQLP